MKKMIIGLFASSALVLGSGAFVSGASAADPYPGTVPTVPTVPAAPTPPAPPGPSTVPTKPETPTLAGGSVPSSSTVVFVLKVGAGNAKVGGKIKITFNGKVYFFKVKNGVANIKFKAPKLKGYKKGATRTKTFKYEFKPYTGSVFKSSHGKAKVVVKKK